ncbi:dienelactone hydrolase family protein [Elioraea rosea]|uniref:hypothetical protein n=1 Tax=Elioraea rosea TaxID=2492390 RepID=UPI0013157A65|nr:hypothetical protein [Elioraea rosea]
MLQGGSRDADLIEVEPVRAQSRATVASALRAVCCAAAAALLCFDAGSIPARAGQQDAAITLLALGNGGHGVLSVPMPVDTAGLPAVVVVHDMRGHNFRALLYVDKLLALGITVLEIEPFPQVTNGVAALPIVDDLDAAMLVTEAADALALAGEVDPRAIGVVGFGAGARAVLLVSRLQRPYAIGSARPALSWV